MPTMSREPDCGNALLVKSEPPPFTVINPGGTSAVVLVCDHASNLIPRSLDNLGLNAKVLNTHIAWDPGAAVVAKSASSTLDAALVLSGYSRLVIDCNRPLKSPESIPEQSAGVWIPGNQNLTLAERKQRIAELFIPYQQAIARLLERRSGPTVLISIHSFVPELYGKKRPWQVGVSGYCDHRLARALYSALRQTDGLSVGFDQPYAIEAEFDYTLPIQGSKRGLHCAMVEIRQDEIASINNAQRWAERLTKAWSVAESVLAL